MKKKSRKIYIIFFFIGLSFASYCGYLVAGAWYEGVPTDELFRRLMFVFENPFSDYRNDNTMSGILIAWGIYGIIFLMYMTSLKNLMPGKEFGVARWGDPKKITKKFADKDDEFNNMIISKNVRLCINDRKTRRNANVLVSGGSGAGKSWNFVKPNLLQLTCSYVITDCKGELYRALAPVFRANGYRVVSLNFIEPENSDCYNPFSYLRKEIDVIKLITNLFSNTTPKNANMNDPFWEKAEGLFLQAIFYFVWMEMPKSKRNIESVLKLMDEAEVTDGKKQSELDRRFERLEKRSPLGKRHPAIIKYNKALKKGAADTIRSILVSADARLAVLQVKEILRLLSRDEMNLAELGTGVNGDGKTKTALFCIIPDDDDSYNFLVGMLYTQMFQELYYQADFLYKGRLPIHVKCMFDEFANVSLPSNFIRLLSTMRGRNISSTIIIQDFSQIEDLFDKKAKTLKGNCDTFVYLGGNEETTFEQLNKLLDKKTIDKRTHGESSGHNSSSSKNYDVMGRDLMTIGELRKLDDDKCLVFIRGVDPVIDDKYVPFDHPRFYQSGDANESLQADMEQKPEQQPEPEVVIINADALEYYKKMKKRGADIRIDSIEANELLSLSEEEFISGQRIRRFTDMVVEEETSIKIVSPDTEESGEKTSRKMEKSGETIIDRMLKYDFSEEQFEEAKLALKSGISENELLHYFYPHKTVEMLKQSREQMLKN